MDEFCVGTIVWASARNDIFWPGKVVEISDPVESSKQAVTVNFFIEDSYEDIKNAKKLFQWNCERQQEFIEKGRGTLKDVERKIEFNKAVAEADDLFLSQEKNAAGGNSNGKVSPSVKSRCVTDQKGKAKLSKSRKMEITATRRSPRNLMTNGNSHDRLASSTENERKDMKLNSTQCNGRHRTCFPAEYQENRTKTNGEVSAGDCCPKMQHSDYSARHQDFREKTASETDLNVSASLGRNRGKQPIKRRFNEEDSASYTRLICAKKSRKGEQHGVANNNSFETTSVKSKLGEDMERDKSIVNSSHETVPESGETSDEELFKESFSPKKEENKFSVDDIVWAKFYREPYWPAVIKKVNEKTKTNPKKKYVVKFLGWTDCLFKIQPNKLVHFACNAKQRSEFMGMKMGNEELQGMFDKALVQAEDFMNRKGLGKGFEDEKDEEHFQIFEDDDAENGEESDVKKAPNVPPSTSLSECRKSLRARKPVSKYSNILSYIRQAKPILKDILSGTKHSNRHETYTRGRVSEKNLLKKQSGFGPVADETLREGIMDLLMDFYREFCGRVDLTYISDVWLPEAIIQSISKMDNVDTAMAEEKFRAGFKDAVSYDEVFQLITKLKQRKSTAEKNEEILGCTERAAS